MTTFYVGNDTRFQVRDILHFKGDIKEHKVDYSLWVDDNATVTGVTWTVEEGQATISGEALASNVSTITLTTSEMGSSMIKAVCTDGTHSEAIYIQVVAKDPKPFGMPIDDYGFYGYSW